MAYQKYYRHVIDENWFESAQVSLKGKSKGPSSTTPAGPGPKKYAQDAQ